MMRLGHTVTATEVEAYTDFIDWAFEGKNRDEYDWAFCTYMDGMPYIHFGYGVRVNYTDFLNREEDEKKFNESQKRKQKKQKKIVIELVEDSTEL